MSVCACVCVWEWLCVLCVCVFFVYVYEALVKESRLPGEEPGGWDSGTVGALQGQSRERRWASDFCLCLRLSAKLCHSLVTQGCFWQLLVMILQHGLIKLLLKAEASKKISFFPPTVHQWQHHLVPKCPEGIIPPYRSLGPWSPVPVWKNQLYVAVSDQWCTFEWWWDPFNQLQITFLNIEVIFYVMKQRANRTYLGNLCPRSASIHWVSVKVTTSS